MAENLQQFLKPSRYCESDDSGIRELSKNLTKGEKTERGKAEALFNWVKENVNYDIVPMVGAKKVLDKKPMVSMCYDKTNLFVALCRSLGIPSRYIIFDCELKVNRNDISSKAKHIVAEIFIDGNWTVVDPSFEDEIKSLIEPSVFGVPTWNTWKNVKRKKGLPVFLVFLINNLLIKAPFFKKLRAAIQEARSKG